MGKLKRIFGSNLALFKSNLNGLRTTFQVAFHLKSDMSNSKRYISNRDTAGNCQNSTCFKIEKR